MLSLFRVLTDRVKALFVTAAALELEAEFVARAAGCRARPLRQAPGYDAEGLRGIAQHLRQQAEAAAVERPLAGVLPAVAHLQADLAGAAATAAPPTPAASALPSLDAPASVPALPGPKKRGGKS